MFVPNIGGRILEERTRLKLSQQRLADQAGVTLRSQRNYEKGDRCPDGDYLAVLLELGCDVLYVLSGKRSVQLGEVLSEDERQLISLYRGASLAVKNAAVGALIGAGGKPGGQTINGAVAGDVISGNLVKVRKK